MASFVTALTSPPRTTSELAYRLGCGGGREHTGDVKIKFKKLES
jgi:hypothetical protein